MNAEKGRLDCTLTGVELDLAEAQQQIQHLEVIPDPPLAWSPCRAQEVLGVGQQGSLEPPGECLHWAVVQGSAMVERENVEAH